VGPAVGTLLYLWFDLHDLQRSLPTPTIL